MQDTSRVAELKATIGATSVGKMTFALMVAGGAGVLLGLVMLFAGQTWGFTRASQRELDEMATTPVSGPAGLTVNAIDKRGAFESYMTLLERWNTRGSVDSMSTGLRIGVVLDPATPRSVVRQLRDLEAELASVDLLSKVGSSGSYEVRVSYSGMILPGRPHQVAVFRSAWWETMADYSVPVLGLGFALFYVGFGILVYLNEKRRRLARH